MSKRYEIIMSMRRSRKVSATINIFFVECFSHDVDMPNAPFPLDSI